jgi:uncharacterized membrane protein YhhN
MSIRQQSLAPHLWWWAAVVAGVSYCVPAWAGWQDAWVIAWKGAGVGLLAVHAALSARQFRVGLANSSGGHYASGEARQPSHSSAKSSSLTYTDAVLLTAVMACGAVGDILLDAISLVAGAAWFALGHLLAMGLYWRNRRVSRNERLGETGSLQGAATRLWPFWLGVPVALGLTAALAKGQPLADVAVGYTLLVALMAAFAWRSRFPRHLVGLGAFLFLVSDLLIFTRTAGPLPMREAAGLLVWPLYFGGQALIARGVVQGLRATGE